MAFYLSIDEFLFSSTPYVPYFYREHLSMRFNALLAQPNLNSRAPQHIFFHFSLIILYLATISHDK